MDVATRGSHDVFIHRHEDLHRRGIPILEELKVMVEKMKAVEEVKSAALRVVLPPLPQFDGWHSSSLSFMYPHQIIIKRRWLRHTSTRGSQPSQRRGRPLQCGVARLLDIPAPPGRAATTSLWRGGGGGGSVRCDSPHKGLHDIWIEGGNHKIELSVPSTIL
jgi:hypothetical protein